MDIEDVAAVYPLVLLTTVPTKVELVPQDR